MAQRHPTAITIVYLLFSFAWMPVMTSFKLGGVLGSSFFSKYGLTLGTIIAAETAAPYIIRDHTITGSKYTAFLKDAPRLMVAARDVVVQIK
eukprot:CAMPEP_0202900058 /NCGR_PEP_ID=MMETSP1392-20130828/9603_1 /ASSEMBLY_ACC=CAM_ASM_000868 /TAXON_ID=225041 /ORGANISM="Chlamydomonas chlamydogama, Strain SAG 11-48b" /LENGTH=91 /DNA_ID=CAMNT_0049586375 /DNA_START=622 /DNA_END=897 /DNA_ORIENTATION=-